ncbi:hypothetical protein D3C87_1477860 [compost metagenome]
MSSAVIAVTGAGPSVSILRGIREPSTTTSSTVVAWSFAGADVVWAAAAKAIRLLPALSAQMMDLIRRMTVSPVSLSFTLQLISLF